MDQVYLKAAISQNPQNLFVSLIKLVYWEELKLSGLHVSISPLWVDLCMCVYAMFVCESSFSINLYTTEPFHGPNFSACPKTTRSGKRISMKAMQASCDRSSLARTFFSSGCLSGSRVQHHSLSFPRFLVIITRLSVCLGGGLKWVRGTEREN